MHVRTQADTDAGATVQHRQREGPINRRRRTLVLRALRDMQPGAIQKRQHASPRWGDSLAGLVSVATADDGVTAPTHAGTHADADATTVQHAWWGQREGQIHRRRRIAHPQ